MMNFKIKSLLWHSYSFASMVASYIKIKALGTNIAKLEIGSGPHKRKGWLTVDMCNGADVFWDLRKALPFKDASFHQVYCSHVLEHFAYQDLMALLREVHRVLRVGGEFLIAVPDASLYVDAYLGKRDGEELLRYRPAVISSNRMDILNYMFYMDGHHRFMFDAENLAFHCKAAGFSNCVSRPFDSLVDMLSRDYESLYFSCRKTS
ncbi:MAG: methyltransferase domain-containing protein [Burkholderiales bacterium]|nr:methyltransferase domain-containing protein [Burkholderiales bacterium]